MINPANLDFSKLSPEEQEELDLLLHEERADYLGTELSAYMREAWQVLEPGRTLVWSWHYDYIAEWLTMISTGEFKRQYPEKQGIIINVPPRTLKSKFITVGWPTWDWTKRPTRRFLCASYSKDLSTEHSKYRRDLIRSDFYQRYWAGEFKFAADQNLKTKFENDHHGAQIATSVGGTATGTGGDILIVDDPLNPEQAASDVERVAANKWFDETLRSRLNDPATGVIVVVMQRLHEDDVTGHLTGMEPDGWIHLKIPLVEDGLKRQRADGTSAPPGPKTYKFPISGRVVTREPGDVLQPERFTPEVIERIKKRAIVYAGQYQQEPAPAEGNIIKRAWVRYYGGPNDRPLPERFDRVLLSVDCSFKDPDQAKAGADLDYVALLTVGVAGADRYGLDLDLRQMGEPETQNAILAAIQREPRIREVLIEDKANGSSVIRAMRRKISGVIAVEPEGGKVARFFAASSSWESGNWYVPREDDQRHPWAGPFIHHIVTFPNCTHDDDCDAMSQADIRLQAGGAPGLMDFLDRQLAATKKTPVPPGMAVIESQSNDIGG